MYACVSVCEDYCRLIPVLIPENVQELGMWTSLDLPMMHEP